MKILFDSSSLIASIIEAHPKHESALSWLKKVKNSNIDASISAHSLLEIYSVLTSAPFKPKISPELARELINTNIKKHFKIVSLSPKEYFALIDFLSSNDFKGGIVYDALIFKCAQKLKVNKLITLNAKDFVRLNFHNSIEVVSI